MSFMETMRLRSKMLTEWREVASVISRIVQKNLPDARVYVLGSVVKGDFTAGSDVDILIVSERVPESALGRARLRTRVEEKADLPYYHPFEFHFADPHEAEQYLRRARPWVIPMTGGERARRKKAARA